MTRRSRISLHGKQGANQEVRDAVEAVRADGHHVEVRVTWEAGDSALFAAEAAKQGIDTVIAGGGDGTVNEVLNGLVQVEGQSSALGVIPLGTANDFARIPEMLSDHPDTGSRVSDIQREAKRLGCSTKPADPSRWKAFQQSLPTNEPGSEAAPR